MIGYIYWIGVLINLVFFSYGFYNPGDNLKSVIRRHSKNKTNLRLAISISISIISSWLFTLLLIFTIFIVNKEIKEDDENDI